MSSAAQLGFAKIALALQLMIFFKNHSRRVYYPHRTAQELCMRVGEGLPFVGRPIIARLLQCAIAQALNLYPVKICAMVWMGNHLHMIVVSYDAEVFMRFYSYLGKRITDFMKRIYGKKHLLLWPQRPTVALIADPAKMEERLQYLYLNPARAHLTEHIQEYPGLNSWEAFTQSASSLDAEAITTIKTFCAPDLTPLTTNNPTAEQERQFLQSLDQKDGAQLPITIYPNEWMKCFAIQSDMVAKEINARILSTIRNSEEKLKIERRVEGRKVLGPNALRRAPFRQRYFPKEHRQKICVLASEKETRINYLRQLNALTQKCIELFKQWRLGVRWIDWPAGMFPPRPPIMVNALL